MSFEGCFLFPQVELGMGSRPQVREHRQDVGARIPGTWPEKARLGVCRSQSARAEIALCLVTQGGNRPRIRETGPLYLFGGYKALIPLGIQGLGNALPYVNHYHMYKEMEPRS